MTGRTAADALVALPPEDLAVIALRRQFIEAVEEVHRLAGLLGIDHSEASATFALRADAWLWRTQRLLGSKRP